jgi:hypothetical protein
MFEYAYIEDLVKGNSRDLVEFLSRFRKFFESGIISEIAYTSGGISFFAIREPILLAIRVRGGIGEAKFQALKLLKDLGYVSKEILNFEEIFKFVEKIDQMPLEEFLMEIRRLRSQL